MASDAYLCPHCTRPVFLTRPTPAPDRASGLVVLDVSPLIYALTLHLRYGCDEV